MLICPLGSFAIRAAMSGKFARSLFRATRRAGELLEQIEPNKGGRPKTQVAADPSLSRKQVASDAGMSERQQKTAIRVAKVPEREFNKQVDGPTPPTVTALAKKCLARKTNLLRR